MFTRLYKPGISATIGGVTVRNLDGYGLRVAFSVSRSMSAEPDSAEIAIYNISEQTRSDMLARFNETGRAKVEIRAGYDGTIVQLFRGDLRRSTTKVQPAGGDVPSAFIADDAGDALAEARISVSSLGLSVRDMINVALAALAREDEPIAEHPSVQAAISSAGVEARASLFEQVSLSSATDLLDEAARTIGARWFVRDRQLYLAKNLLPTDGIAIELPRSHWLSYPAQDTSGFWRFSTLLDPRIVPGRQIILVGRTAPGSRDVLRAELCRYVGDTNASAPWKVDIAARLSI